MYRGNIEESLGALIFDEKPRFKFSDKKSTDIQFSMVSSENSKEISGKDLIPVVHIYSLLDSIKQSELDEYNIFVLSKLNSEFLKEEYGLSSLILDSSKDLLQKLEEDDGNIGFIDFNDLNIGFKILSLDDHYYLEDDLGSLSVNSVSYTHLDVYKRQIVNRHNISNP